MLLMAFGAKWELFLAWQELGPGAGAGGCKQTSSTWGRPPAPVRKETFGRVTAESSTGAKGSIVCIV